MSLLFKTNKGNGAKFGAMKIQLQTVNLQVADPEVSKRFYVEALGMAENLQRSHPPGFFYLESAGCHLTLAQIEEGAGEKPARTVELGFEVDDLSSLQAHLLSKGLNGFTPQTMGWGEVIEGYDPDGHRLVVYSLSPKDSQRP